VGVALPGVKIGPLDPDRTADFGQVSASTSARQLVRHHAAMYPPELRRILSLSRQHERTKALDPEEVEAAVHASFEDDGQDVPENLQVTGCAVRGEDDATQYVTWTYLVESGRTAKGAALYDDEAFSKSIADGDENVAIAKAREAGLPWIPQATAQAIQGGRPANAESGGDPEAEALREENDELRASLDELRERLAAVEGQQPTPEQEAQAGDGDGAADGADAGGGEPAVPEGYDDLNADVIRQKISAGEYDRPTLEAIVAYERANANRSTVVSAGEQKLDATTG
jgi:hypothetical protein